MTEDQALEEFFSKEPQPEDDGQTLSRRQFLRGGLTGGAAGLAVAAGAGAAVWKIGDAQLQNALADADSEIARLQGLVDLYEDLEKIGLDAILETGMAAVVLPLEGVELGARGLKRGLELVEDALLSLEEAIPSAHESILWLEDKVSMLASGVHKLETALGDALDRATDNAVAEALADLAGMILDNLPFGLGEKIRGVLDGLVALVTGVDDLIAGINTSLLQPLREKWFATEDGKGIVASLVEPLIEHLLDPLEGHLGDLAVLVDTWQQKLLAPSQHALQERSEVRESIARYKNEHGFG